MARSPRILLTEGRVVEVSSRTLLGMYLLRTTHRDDFRPSRAKPFLASSLEEYLAMKQVRDSILAAYRDASERLRRGEKNVEFPENTFPPAGPFVDPRGPPL